LASRGGTILTAISLATSSLCCRIPEHGKDQGLRVFGTIAECEISWSLGLATDAGPIRPGDHDPESTRLFCRI
jgi:hypothetical protein